MAKSKRTTKKKTPAKRKRKAVAAPRSRVPSKKKNETWKAYHDRLSSLAYAARAAGDTSLATRIEARAGAIARKYKSVRQKPRKRGAQGPGTYPWNECVAQQIAAGYDEETARKICGAIRSRSRKKYPAYWAARGNPMSTLDALKKDGYVKVKGKKVEVTNKGLRMLQQNPSSAEGAAIGALIGAWAGTPLAAGIGAYLGGRLAEPVTGVATRAYAKRSKKNPGHGDEYPDDIGDATLIMTPRDEDPALFHVTGEDDGADAPHPYRSGRKKATKKKKAAAKRQPKKNPISSYLRNL